MKVKYNLKTCIAGFRFLVVKLSKEEKSFRFLHDSSFFKGILYPLGEVLFAIGFTEKMFYYLLLLKLNLGAKMHFFVVSP